MASFASIPVLQAARNEFLTPAAFSGMTTAIASNGASSATYGAYFTPGRGDKCMILVQNVCATSSTPAKHVTLKAGNGLQGVGDLSVDLANGEYTVLTVDTGRFKNVCENDALKALSSATASDQVPAKGKIFITGADANIKVAVFQLP